MDSLSEKAIKIMRKTMDSKGEIASPHLGPLVCKELGNFTHKSSNWNLINTLPVPKACRAPRACTKIQNWILLFTESLFCISPNCILRGNSKKTQPFWLSDMWRNPSSWKWTIHLNLSMTQMCLSKEIGLVCLTHSPPADVAMEFLFNRVPF